jgi:hypothetical protein
VTGTLMLKAHCAICGTDRIQLPDVATEKSEVQCNANHSLGSYEEVKLALLEGITAAATVDRKEPIFEPLRRETVQTTARAPLVAWSDDGDPYIRFFWINGTHSDVKMAHRILDQLARDITKTLSERSYK